MLKAKQYATAKATAAGPSETPLTPDLGDSSPRSARIARGTAAWGNAMLKALGQADRYARALPATEEPLPFFLFDEGGYWPGRDVTVLRAHLNRLSGIIAGLAGALKDAADDAGAGPVRTPIFAHPEFERLEADGVSAHAADLARAMALIRPPE